MQSYEYYHSIIEKTISEIEYPAKPAGLYEPIRYAMSTGGKRLRPVLTLATADALGARPEKAVWPALAVEMFHNFTLLHDDIMDRADVRRGRPTVHIRWNEATAILSGDAMLSMASIILSNSAAFCQSHSAMNKLFNRTAMEVYEGQQFDMDFEKRTDVTEEEYIEMIRLKTSVLLGCACEMGALAADADTDICHQFYKFGEKLGLAFQLRDDYLDTYGSFADFGKEPGGDILNDKKTWLSIAAMADSRSSEVVSLFGPTSDPAVKISRVKAFYDAAELPQRIDSLINRYSNEALRALDNTDISPEAKEFFIRLTNDMIHRAR